MIASGQLRIESDPSEAPEVVVDEALAAYGLYASEPIVLEDTFALWPENLPIFNLYQSLQTQWRVKDNGSRSGLDYAGVMAAMSMQGVRKKDQADMFAGLQVMEYEALVEWAKKK